MKIDLYKKVSLRNFVELFLLCALPIICVCGVSYIPFQLREPLIYLAGLVILIFIIISKEKIRIGALSLFYFLFLTYIAISLFYSYDKESTFSYFTIYLALLPLLFFDITEKTCLRLLSIFGIITTVIAVSIIISVPVDNCMNNYFWFIVNPGRNYAVTKGIAQELATGAYSGFAREKGEAAFLMNVGLATCFAKYFAKGKITFGNVLSIILHLAALLLTSKRTLFAIVVVCFCALMLVSKMQNKTSRTITVIILSVFAVFIILNFIPSLANTFLRLIDTENMQELGGRSALWEYLYLMIDKFWLFGAGFGSYNNFAYDNGLRTYGTKWNYNGHNNYYQALGEIGVVGCFFLFGFLIISFIRTTKLIRNKGLTQNQNKILYFSFYLQIMLLVYSVTGNPLYTRQIIYVWILAICMYLSIYHKTVKNKYKEKFGKKYTTI